MSSNIDVSQIKQWNGFTARAKLNREVNSIFLSLAFTYGQLSACIHDNVLVRLSNSRYAQYFFFKTDRFDLNLYAFLKSNIE